MLNPRGELIAAALQGLLARYGNDFMVDEMAELSVRYADAVLDLLEERETARIAKFKKQVAEASKDQPYKD